MPGGALLESQHLLHLSSDDGLGSKSSLVLSFVGEGVLLGLRLSVDGEGGSRGDESNILLQSKYYLD